VTLTAAEPRAVVVVRNGGKEPVRLEVKAMAWGQAPDGQMELGPTDEILAFPPMLTVEAGDERNLRVATSARPGPAERSFRVFVQELPPPEKPGVQQVRVLSRLGIPVFVAPTRGMARAELEAIPADPGRARFALRNAGTLHLAPTSIRIAGLDAAGKPVQTWTAEAWYVLAGGERRFDVALPAEHCADVRSLDLQASPLADQPPLRTRVELPAGACAP
jgi:fimbrial chaperone protein